MKIGFTGTRFGMNEFQKEKVKDTILKFANVLEFATHGDCVGSDADFHDIIRDFSNAAIHIRPGVFKDDKENHDFRANKEADIIYKEDTHFSRNRSIVDASDFLIATPHNQYQAGGTWYTINYARKQKKRGIIIFRDSTEEL